MIRRPRVFRGGCLLPRTEREERLAPTESEAQLDLPCRVRADFSSKEMKFVVHVGKLVTYGEKDVLYYRDLGPERQVGKVD